MKINLKSKLAMMLMFSNRFQVVNQGTNKIPEITEKGIASLDQPQLPPALVGNYYKKGIHAKSIEEFTQALREEYDVRCNEAAKKAFPYGMTMLVGEGHSDEAKNIFAHFPGEEHSIVLMETIKGIFGELCMHEEYKNKTLVCEGIDTNPVRDELVALLNETLEAGKEAIKLFNPDRLKEFNPEEMIDISKIIYRYYEILSEELASLELLPDEKVEAFKKFENLGMDCIDKIFNSEGSDKMQQRDETMTKNLVEYIEMRDNNHPNTTIWTYIGKLHTEMVSALANQHMKRKTPICRVDIKNKILMNRISKSPSL